MASRADSRSATGVDKLIYYEVTEDVLAAIAREKQIKGWLRRKKVELIEAMNPLWIDLGEMLFPGRPDPSSA